MFLRNLLILLFTILLASKSYALREPRPLTTDNRIRTIVYNPDDVFKFTGFYGFQANMEFGEDEIIENISMGDSVAWQIIPNGKRLFLKPVEADATTNMTLITNKRLYNFELHAKEAKSINDEDMVFTLRFMYPEENNFIANTQSNRNSYAPDMKKPEKYNFDYTISGEGSIAPTQIFDDGEFTYFKFKSKNAVIPAFFIVDSDTTEEMVNYRIMGDYVVVELVTSQFTLRNGNDIICVFNERIPLKIRTNVKRYSVKNNLK